MNTIAKSQDRLAEIQSGAIHLSTSEAAELIGRTSPGRLREYWRYGLIEAKPTSRGLVFLRADVVAFRIPSDAEFERAKVDTANHAVRTLVMRKPGPGRGKKSKQ